jgi:hypothetical protein
MVETGRAYVYELARAAYETAQHREIISRFIADDGVSQTYVGAGVPLLDGVNHRLAKLNPNTIH